jgi:hypothetical protein
MWWRPAYRRPTRRRAASQRWDGVRLEVECPPDRESTTGGGSADRRVPALRAAEHTRAPRGGDGPLAQPRIPSKGAARGNDRRGLGQGPPPDSDDRPGGITMGNGHSRVACIRCAGSTAPILRVPPLRRPRSLHPENLRSSRANAYPAAPGRTGIGRLASWRRGRGERQGRAPSDERRQAFFQITRNPLPHLAFRLRSGCCQIKPPISIR